MMGIINIQNVSTQFNGQVIHDHLSFHVEKGEILCIVGGSGSGKSVLMRMIIGLDAPQQGIIAYEKPYSPKNVGVLFQHGALISSLTVLENVSLPLKTAYGIPEHLAEEIASFKLLQVGLTKNDFSKYPANLSGGMIKRVGIARALALDPPILFLDEPTAGLDPIAAHDFDELILKIKENFNLTVVMITHDLDTISHVSDRVGVLVDHKMYVMKRDEITHVTHPWMRSYFLGERGTHLFLEKAHHHHGF